MAVGALPLIGIVGATATGKSDLALALARRVNGEVVNADAMQLYRGMDVGTAKLAIPERQGVPHHQLDVISVTDEASVSAYQRHARTDISGIQDRGRAAILVGGSGLYVRAVVDALDIPPTDPVVRARLENELERLGVAALFARLAETDPHAAAHIEPRNSRRVVRALEVIELTGRPFSASMPRREFVQPTVLVGLRVPRPTLDERIAARVQRMWRAGLIDEVRRLCDCGLREGRTASKAVGYSQALAYLDGELTSAAAMEQTTIATRRLVRRQESWFGADPRVTWLDAERPDLVDEAIKVIAAAAD